MKYNKFLFKESIFLIILYLFSIAGSFAIHIVWFKESPLENLLFAATQTAAWIITSYIYFIDMNGNMISRLIINGGTRSGIWLSKALTTVLAAVFMIIIQSAVLLADRGSLNQSSDAIIKVLAVTVLLMTFVGSFTAFLSVVIKNMSVVVILIFAYICPWTYAVAANFCERSSIGLVRKNPFYMLLKMSNSGMIERTAVISCAVTAAVLWIASLAIVRRLELRNDN